MEIARSEKSRRKQFYDYTIDKTIKSRAEEIIMFTADNEEELGKRSLKLFHDVLGGKIIKLKGRGHYTMDDMKTEKFPELLNVIL